jgi:phytoene dehydrogenase-like protein
VRYRHRGRTTRLPPAAPWRVLKLARHSAPVGTDFRGWAAAICGEETAEQLSRIATAVTFDHDPGRLSAAFVWERLRWVYAPPPAVRFVLGGWSPLVERLTQHARQLGVTIETGRRVTAPPPPPVIVATELDQARELLGDDTLRWDGARTLLLDLGLESKRGDPVALFDLDAGGFIERYTSCDRSLAPPGHELVQAQVGLRPDETAEEANARIEQGLDAGFAGWRERLVWHRRQLADARSGALDLPGRTWRDRPAIDRGAGIYLAGDMTAAPGVLSEVSFASALHAARLAVAWQPRRPTDRSAHDEG